MNDIRGIREEWYKCPSFISVCTYVWSEMGAFCCKDLVHQDKTSLSLLQDKEMACGVLCLSLIPVLHMQAGILWPSFWPSLRSNNNSLLYSFLRVSRVQNENGPEDLSNSSAAVLSGQWLIALFLPLIKQNKTYKQHMTMFWHVGNNTIVTIFALKIL